MMGSNVMLLDVAFAPVLLGGGILIIFVVAVLVIAAIGLAVFLIIKSSRTGNRDVNNRVDAVSQGVNKSVKEKDDL